MNESASTSRRAFLGYGLGVGGLATLTLAGCAPASKSKVGSGGAGKPAGDAALTMSAFGAVTRQQKLQKVYDLYTKKYGGSITLEILSNDQYTQKLSTEIAGGSAADIINLFNNIVAQFASKGTLAQLDKYEPSVLNLSQISKLSAAGGVIDGKRVALPLGDNALGVIYDEGAIKAAGMKMPEPGHTWDEFITFANDLSKKKGDGYYGTIDDSSDLNGLQVFVRQRGKQAFKNGKLGFSKSDLKAWYEIWAELRKTKAAPPGDLTVQTSTGGFGNSLIVEGKASNFFIYPNVLNAFQALTKSTLAISTMPMPSKAKSGLFIQASNWVGVNARNSHIPDAVNFINFMLNDKGANDVLQAEFGAPPNQKLRAATTFNEVDQKFIDYVNLVAEDYAQPLGSLADAFPPGFPQVSTAFKTVGQSIATGKETISSGVDQFFQQAAGFLA